MSLQYALSWHVLAIYVFVLGGYCFNAFYFYFISDSALPSAPHICTTCGGQKTVSDPLEL